MEEPSTEVQQERMVDQTRMGAVEEVRTLWKYLVSRPECMLKVRCGV
jgi:hypothetical protein